MIFLYNTFIGEYKSKDGIPVVVAGIYKDGDNNKILDCYSKLSEKNINITKDIFMIDYILAETVSKLSPKEVVAVGATIHIDGISLATGGVIGNPFEESDSAEGLLEKINDDIYVVASPGNMGIAFVGNEKLGKKLEDFLSDETLSQEECIKKVQEIGEKECDLYFIISDGCGEGRNGVAITYEMGKKTKIAILTKK